jgi:hypothetical protein
MIQRIPCAVALLVGALAVNAQPRVAATKGSPAAVPPPKSRGSLEQFRIEPVILTRSSLDDKVVALRLAPRIATSIRLPEPVNSVVVGDPENFQAEHSEREPNLVTVKPVTEKPAQTNLLITTALGQELNLLLVSPGEQAGGSLPVDVLLTYGRPRSGSFLVEEMAFPTSLVAETTKLAPETKPVASGPGPQASTVTQLVSLLKTGGHEGASSQQDASSEGLDKCIRQSKPSRAGAGGYRLRAAQAIGVSSGRR